MQYFLLVILSTAVFMLLFALLRGSGKNAARTGKRRSRYDRPDNKVRHYKAVSIRPASDSCQAAVSLEGYRFLTNHAPRLPIPECDAIQCHCRYEHHEDRRRNEGDRRFNIGGKSGVPANVGRDRRIRHGPGRRQSDWARA